MKSLTRRLFLLLTILSIGSCGGSVPKAGAEWNPDDAPFFDDGVDVIENPTILAGTWGGRQKNWMEGRIQLADVIAIVEIRTVQINLEIEKEKGRRIDVSIGEVIYGTPLEKQLSLASLSSAPGYELIERYEKHLSGKFILFYRDFIEPEGRGSPTVGHHFHLSPASEELTAYVKKQAAFRFQAENE